MAEKVKSSNLTSCKKRNPLKIKACSNFENFRELAVTPCAKFELFLNIQENLQNCSYCIKLCRTVVGQGSKSL